MMLNDFSALETLSIKEIKALLDGMSVENTPFDEAKNAIERLSQDPRCACQKMAIQFSKRILAYENESLRMKKIFEFEREAWAMGYDQVAGIDEAGRGPLVGPVVAAAVILDPRIDWRGIDDSKKLTAEQRQVFYERIVNHAIAYGVGVATHSEIDDINILNATKCAMNRALSSLKVTPNYLLIDAVKLADNPTRQLNLIKGDSRSASIAAASIIAKVTRDKMMIELHQEHPEYDFAQHKGYGTDKHYDAIRKYGLIAEHRRSFLKGL